MHLKCLFEEVDIIRDNFERGLVKFNERLHTEEDSTTPFDCAKDVGGGVPWVFAELVVV